MKVSNTFKQQQKIVHAWSAFALAGFVQVACGPADETASEIEASVSASSRSDESPIFCGGIDVEAFAGLDGIDDYHTASEYGPGSRSVEKIAQVSDENGSIASSIARGSFSRFEAKSWISGQRRCGAGQECEAVSGSSAYGGQMTGALISTGEALSIPVLLSVSRSDEEIGLQAAAMLSAEIDGVTTLISGVTIFPGPNGELTVRTKEPAQDWVTTTLSDNLNGSFYHVLTGSFPAGTELQYFLGTATLSPQVGVELTRYSGKAEARIRGIRGADLSDVDSPFCNAD